MKLLHEPFLHFLVIGAVLFGVFRLASADGEQASGEIVVSAGQIASMEATFSRTWQRPPTDTEMEALVIEHIRDEVLYREGVAMGLDRDDSVIRRRVRQKLEFVADLAVDAQPNDAQLKTFVAENPALFRTEPRLSFTHVYFQASAVPNAADLESLRQGLNSGTVDQSNVGKPFMAGFDFSDFTSSAIKQTFGEGFAAWIDRAGSGDWQGPVTSAYGTHLVLVSERIEARDLPFEQVREAALREWQHGRKVAANDALYERLRSRYVIKVEEAPGEEKLAEAGR